jgi:hygromycin-B 7''-O-kinase
MNYVIESIQQWAPIMTDPDYWRPMVEHIVRKHNLGEIQQIRPGYPGSNAVFWVNETVIVKIFAPFWQEGFERELESYQYLAPYDELQMPKVLAHGAVEAGQAWKYVVMEGLAGAPIFEVWEKIPRDNRLEIAEHFGRMIQKLHQIPVDGIRSMDTSRAGWRRFVQTQMERCVAHHRDNQSLPEHLLAQIPDFLEQASPLFPPDFSPCIVNSDLTRDHLLLSQIGGRWQITGLIDFGDVEVGHRDYEFVALHLDAFGGDAELTRAFLQTYEYPNGIDPRFNQRMMAYSILHRYLRFNEIPFLTARYGGDLEAVKTLDELGAILWGI